MQVYILCGGKSSRMQTEKGLVLYHNKPFIEHIIGAVLPIAKDIYLVTNSKDYDYLGYPIVNDLVANKGPLGGIYSALAQSESELNLILSCDIPLISTEILLELTNKHSAEFEISVFNEADKTHPLIGIYSKKLVSIVKEEINANRLKMMDFISKNKHQLIPIQEENKKLFKNINSIADLNSLELI